MTDSVATLTVTSTADLERIVAFCAANNIRYTLYEEDVRQEDDDIKMTPSRSLKDFCGSHNLTTSGHISLDWAVDAVKNYIKVRGLTVVGTTIYLDSTLQELFSNTVTTIQVSELRHLLRTMVGAV